MHSRIFANRDVAGRQLGITILQHVNLRDPLVLGLAPGGVAVAAEVARVLGSELYVVDIRTRGDPSWPEVAICAFGEAPESLLRTDVVLSYAAAAVHSRPARPDPKEECHTLPYPCIAVPHRLRGRDVLLVDDSLAAGTRMLTAIRAAKWCGAHRIIVAVPVGHPGLCAVAGSVADRVICPLQPPSFVRAEDWYEDFTRLTDADIWAIAEAAHRARELSGVSRPGLSLLDVVGDNVRPDAG